MPEWYASARRTVHRARTETSSSATSARASAPPQRAGTHQPSKPLRRERFEGTPERALIPVGGRGVDVLRSPGGEGRDACGELLELAHLACPGQFETKSTGRFSTNDSYASR